MSQTEENKSINQKIAQLDENVEWFYGDDFALDQAIEKYQQAVKLAQSIEQDLSKLKNQVEVVADFTK